PESHLRNHSVYAIRPNHIYEIIPCTRYTRITSTKSLRVRETPACRPNESPHTRHRTKRHPSTTGRVPLPHILKRSHDFPRGFVVLLPNMRMRCFNTGVCSSMNSKTRMTRLMRLGSWISR